MRKFFTKSMLIIAVMSASIFSSCSDDDNDSPSNYMKVNDQQSGISFGAIES